MADGITTDAYASVTVGINYTRIYFLTHGEVNCSIYD